MNIDTFVSARQPELQRFAQVLEQSVERRQTRLARPIPIRPLAADALRRPCASPFNACPELNREPRVPPIATVTDSTYAPARVVSANVQSSEQQQQQHSKNRHQKCLFNLRRELRCTPRNVAQRQLCALLLPRNPRSSSTSGRKMARGGDAAHARKAKMARRRIRRRLFIKRRRGAKRALCRRLAVTCTGVRPGLTVDGRCCYRAYVPSHSFLSKRFSFGDVGAVVQLVDASLSSSSPSSFVLQPWTSHHFSQFSPSSAAMSNKEKCAQSLPLHVTVPRASFTKKSMQRVERARCIGSSSSSSGSAATAAVFDLSFGATVQFLGVCASQSQVPELIRRAFFSSSNHSNNNSLCVPQCVGDGYSVSLLDLMMLSRAPQQELQLRQKRLAAVSVFGRVIVTLTADENYDDDKVHVFVGSGDAAFGASSSSSSSVAFSKRLEQRPCVPSAHHHVFQDNSDRASPSLLTDGTSDIFSCCGVRSPFCLCFEGDAASSIVQSALRGAAQSLLLGLGRRCADQQMALAASVRLGVLHKREQGQVLVFGMPLVCADSTQLRYNAMRDAHSLQYLFFSRMFAQAVVRNGAVPGGWEQL